MKITQSTGVQNVLKAYSKTAKKVGKTSGIKDKVEISDYAKEIQLAKKAFSKLPEIREEKVEEIKSLLASGKYKPSAEDVLEKILASAGK